MSGRTSVVTRAIGVVLGLVMAGFSTGIATVKTSSVQLPVTPRAGGQLPASTFVPDPELHAGATNPSMTKARICDPAFRTGSVRPRSSYTQRLKKLEFGDGGTITAPSGRTYTVTGEHLSGSPRDYELDHLVSLQLGGDPESPANLWMQPWERKGARLAPPGLGAEAKDVLEGRLHREVCAGRIDLATAQREISTNWRTAT